MNYIKRLQEQLKDAETNRAAAMQAVVDLQTYLISPKFHDDTTVQTSDVLRHLDIIKRPLLSEARI